MGDVTPVIGRGPGERTVIALTDDEAQALMWAARKGATQLRAEGWRDMANNADILDRACDKLEAANAR